MVNAGIWLRVSDDKQDEEAQRPDLETYCAAHGYNVKREFAVHGRSAWKPGKLDSDKQAVITAFRTGEIDVLVVWAVDRWSRGGIAELLEGMRLVRDAGGKIEFVKDAVLNSEGPAQELILAILGWVAQWESAHKSDRVKAGMERERSKGRIMGGTLPWGYKLKNGEPVRDDAALSVVAEVFERAARGESLSVIAEFLTREGYGRVRTTIPKVLRNPQYVADGVVTGALATAAVEALESRRTGTVRRTSGEHDDYSATVRCRCGRAMHRKMAGGMPAQGVAATRYYRCNEHAEGRPPMIRADDTDALIQEVMGGDTMPYMIPVRTGGDTRDADLAKLAQRIRALDPDSDNYETAHADLMRQRREVKTREPEP